MKFILVCSGGMSTSILISSLEKEAAKLNIENFSAIAVGVNEIESKLDDSYTVLLVAPQVKYKFEEMKKIAESKNVKCYQIQPTEYTSIGAPNLMKSIMKLLG